MAEAHATALNVDRYLVSSGKKFVTDEDLFGPKPVTVCSIVSTATRLLNRHPMDWQQEQPAISPVATDTTEPKTAVSALEMYPNEPTDTLARSGWVTPHSPVVHLCYITIHSRCRVSSPSCKLHTEINHYSLGMTDSHMVYIYVISNLHIPILKSSD